MLIYFLRDFHNMNIRHIESDATDICNLILDFLLVYLTGS